MASRASSETSKTTRNAQQPRATSPTQLVTLPPEIFERIAEECNDASVKAPRLTSHESASKVLRTYVSTFFQDLVVLPCLEESLQNISKILRHPTFGKVVRSLSVCPKVMESSSKQDLHRIRQRADKMRESEKDFTMLREFFEQLMLQGRSIEVVITTVDDAVRKPSAHSLLLSQDGMLTLCHYRHHIASITTDAIIRSRVKIQHFSMQGEYGIGATDFTHDPRRGILETLCMRLSSLELVVWCNYRLWGDSGGEFGKVIACGSQFQHLSLDVHWDGEGSTSIYGMGSGRSLNSATIARGVLSGAFPALESLKITGAEISCNNLLHFASQHKRLSLTSLTLVNCSIFGAEDLHLQEDCSAAVEDALRRLTGLEGVQVTAGNRILLYFAAQQ